MHFVGRRFNFCLSDGKVYKDRGLVFFICITDRFSGALHVNNMLYSFLPM